MSLARAVLLSWADDQQRGWDARWVEGAVREVWSPSRGVELAERVIASGPDAANGARRLLRSVRRAN